MQIAHVSDIHFGRLTHPEIPNYLVREVNALEVDLVAISGDLTQRARPREYEPARRMIDGFEAPVVVVPGNHDVYPWWRPIARLWRPLARYRKYISEDLLPTFENEELAVLGINSAYGPTIKGGRIGPEQRARIASYLGEKAGDVFKVLVVHHHLITLQALAPHDLARHAQKTLEAAAEAGVDLILCGHLHVSHVEPVLLSAHEHRLVIASAGTATSDRWRQTTVPTNIYNLISIGEEAFSIEERLYDPQEHRFVRENFTEFERHPMRRTRKIGGEGEEERTRGRREPGREREGER